MIQKLKQLHKEGSSGFTIIEVMIVLTVAALIMLIVFLAIPQLNRNQRNTRRKDVVNRMKAEVENFASNNGGTAPVASAVVAAGNWGTDACGTGCFAGRYLNSLNHNDPTTNAAMTYTFPAAAASVLPSAQGVVNYQTGMICSNEQATNTGASANNYILMTRLEGGAGYCLDNT